MKTAGAILLMLALGLGSIASAQTVISAKSGMIHHVEGAVFLDGKAVEPKFGVFPRVRENSELRTGEGRAEILLAPGMLLWVAENSGLRMESDRLSDIRMQLIGGSALIEIFEVNDNGLNLVLKQAVIGLDKPGVYRVDAEPAQLKVYDGEAMVDQGGQSQEVKKSRMLALNGVSRPEKFDNKTGDALFRWARRRAEVMAMANVSAAKYARDRDLNWGRHGAWVYNQWYGMYSYVPGTGYYRNYWGYGYWSPQRVYLVYNPPTYSGGSGGTGFATFQPNLGYSTAPSTSAGTSSTVAASAPTSSSNASSAPVSRDTGSGGSRGR